MNKINRYPFCSRDLREASSTAGVIEARVVSWWGGLRMVGLVAAASHDSADHTRTHSTSHCRRVGWRLALCTKQYRRWMAMRRVANRATWSRLTLLLLLLVLLSPAVACTRSATPTLIKTAR